MLGRFSARPAKNRAGVSPCRPDDNRVVVGEGFLLSTLMRRQRKVLRHCLAFWLALLASFSAPTHAAPDIESPAILVTSTGTIVSNTNVVSLLLGITWLRYDVSLAANTLVSPVMVNGGTTVLPGPTDSNGVPLMGSIDNPVATLLPLLAAGNTPQYDNGEAVFFSAQYPSFANNPLVIDTATVRVRIYSSDGSLLDEEFLQSFETDVASGLFTGYFQNNPAAGGPGDGLLSMPAGSRIEIIDVEENNIPSPYSQIGADVAPNNPGINTLFVSKRALRDAVAHGDFLVWQIDIENTSTAMMPGVLVSDLLPRGFRFVAGSTTLNGAVLADPITGPDGVTLAFNVGALNAGERVTLRYVTEVTAGARRGVATNIASASAAGGITSLPARYSVKVTEDLFRSDALVIGRVFMNSCGKPEDNTSEGLANVRIYLEDGSTALTDKFGRYHLAGIRPGAHVVQVDTESLPEDIELVPCNDNTRFAGNGLSQFIDVQGGSMWRADFHARVSQAGKPFPDPQPEAETAPAPATTEPAKAGIRLRLTSSSDLGFIHYRAEISGENAAQKNLALVVKLPDALQVVRGSIKRDGNDIALVRNNGLRTITLGDVGENWSAVIEFDAMSASDEAPAVAEALTQVWLTATDLPPERTPRAENSVRLGGGKGGDAVNVTVSTNFPPLSAELSALDKLKLDDVIAQLRELEDANLVVTGHTDSAPIPKNGKKYPFTDNRALSAARAQAVADYLREKLALPEEVVTVIGAGADQPAYSNKTVEGRAKNRRVEVSASSRTSREAGEIAVVRKDSGELLLDLTPIPAARTEPVRAASAPAAITTVAATDEKSGAGNATATAAVTEDSSSRKGGLENLVPGFLDYTEGAHVAQRIQQVRVAMDSRLTPKLTIDGIEVPAARIGYRGTDPKTKMTLYSYIGVDFGERGEHVLHVTGTDGFGNARLNKSINIIRTGDIADVRFVASGENIADGRTPVTFKVELLDEQRRAIPASATLILLESDLIPEDVGDSQNPLARPGRVVKVQPDGTIRMKPVTQSGRYHLRIAWGENRADDFTVFVKPHFRDWILVGIAEGSAAFRDLSGHIAPLTPDERDEGLSVDGRAAFYARGKVRGKWLLTAAYDSDKPSPDGLSDRIDPNAWYTLYGDNSNQHQDAASQRKLYLKIERENFYALFGDFQTGMDSTELSRYQRRLNGAKAEFWGRNIDVLAFVSETRQAYVRDALRGDGTSGLYRLRYRTITPNSESIRIEVRDRFRSETVVRAETLTPYLDYNLDYDTGEIWFKEPVRAQDDAFNPVFIVAEYEVDNGVDDTTGGARIVATPLTGLRIGATAVHEGVGNGSSTLTGADARYVLNERNTVLAEIANTASNLPGGLASPTGATGDGLATVITHEYRSEKLAVDSHIREVGAGFGLGQQSATEDGTRKIGTDIRYNLSDTVKLQGQLSRSEQLDRDRTRDLAEARINLARESRDLFAGVRLVHDEAAGTPGGMDTQHVLGGVRQRLLEDRLQLKLEGEVNVSDDSPGSVDYPHRLRTGADYRISRKATLFAEQEWAWGDEQDSERSSVGVRYIPWKGAQLNSSLGREANEYGPRVYANAGLTQNWTINANWTADAGIDRVQTLQDPGALPFDPDVPSTNGDAAQDFTAVFLGGGYQNLEWRWRGRIETRDGADEDKLNFYSSLYRNVDEATTVGSTLRYLRSASGVTGNLNTSATLQLDYAWRPRQGAWIILDQARYVIDRREDANSQFDGTRLINNFNANWRYDERNETSLQYGAKYVFDTIDNRHYSGYTDLMGVEYRHDLNTQWDVGARASLLHSWGADVLDESWGVFVGFSPEKNIWISLGYNIKGFRDDDFSGANYRDQGFNLALRIKFDQDSVRDLANGRSRLPAPRNNLPAEAADN